MRPFNRAAIITTETRALDKFRGRKKKKFHFPLVYGVDSSFL